MTAGTGRGQPEQLTFDAMPAQLFSCTPSRLATFGCPRRYRYTYLDRPTPPRGAPWARNTVGAVAHLALAQWWSLPRAHRTPDEGAALVERNWQPHGFRDDLQSNAVCAATAGHVRDYLTDRATSGVDPAVDPVGVERTVAVRTEQLAVSGRVDRIDDRGDELVIVDYKTGRRPLDTDDAGASTALALYVLGARRTLRRPCRRVELHHLPSGTVAAFEHTDDSLRAHLDGAEHSAHQIVTATDRLAAGGNPDTVFPAVASASCSWCDFRSACPEGRAASEPIEPWSGLAALPA